jgi:hypothetical protein
MARTLAMKNQVMMKLLVLLLLLRRFSVHTLYYFHLGVE